MKNWIAIIALLVLAGCASPTLKMTDQEITGLSDQELCNYQNNYGPDERRDAEIERRNLICDPYIRECMKRGNTPGTEAMNFCVDLLLENRRLRDQYHSRDPFWHRVHRPYTSHGIYLH